MLTLLQSIRELCAGVRAIHASLPMLQSVKETLDRLMREVEHSDIFRLNRELETERAAHAETKKERNYFHDHATKNAELLTSETSARQEAERELDALTRWRLNLTEPCPELPARTPLVVRIDPEHEGAYVEKIHVFRSHMSPNSIYRHTPESLDATEKAGSDV